MHAGEELSIDASTEDALDAEWLCDLYEFAFSGEELSPPSSTSDNLGTRRGRKSISRKRTRRKSKSTRRKQEQQVVHDFGACLCGCSDHLWAAEAREPWLPRNLDLPRAANPSWRRRL